MPLAWSRASRAPASTGQLRAVTACPHCPRAPCSHLPPPAPAPSDRATAAKAVQVLAEVLALLYAQAALLVQAQALLRANAFLAQYG